MGQPEPSTRATAAPPRPRAGRAIGTDAMTHPPHYAEMSTEFAEIAPPPAGSPPALTAWVERHQRLLLAALLTLALALRLWVSLVLLRNLAFGDQPEYTGGAMRLLDGLPLAVKNAMFLVRPGLQPVHRHRLEADRHPLAGGRACGPGLPRHRHLLVRRPRDAAHRRTRTGGALRHARRPGLPYLLTDGIIGTEALYQLPRHRRRLPPRARPVERPGRSAPGGGRGAALAAGNLVRPNLSTLPLLRYHWRRSPRTVIGIGLALALPLLALTVPWSVAVHRQGYGWIW